MLHTTQTSKSYAGHTTTPLSRRLTCQLFVQSAIRTLCNKHGSLKTDISTNIQIKKFVCIIKGSAEIHHTFTSHIMGRH